MSQLKIALVQDALPFYGGAERVLEAVLEMFPDAPLYTLVYNPDKLAHTRIARSRVITSFINRLPGAQAHYRGYLPLFPLAIEQFDLSDYDVILSFSYAVAHGVLVRPEQVHISFTYTPLRYAWHQYQRSFRSGRLGWGLQTWAIKILLHYLRLWDAASVARVDHFVAISQWVAQLIWRAYRQPAQVIYPPVDVDRFKPLTPRGEYYITLSRLVEHKRVDLVVQAFSRLGLPLLVVGEGPEDKKLAGMAAPNVKLLGWQPEETVQNLLGKAKALVHAAEEEFGIALVEAQASGCPVVAYQGGGAAEIVQDGSTGILFDPQSVDGILAAVDRLESGGLQGSVEEMRWNAGRFGKERFQSELLELIQDKQLAYRYPDRVFSRQLG
jgi:glycosyltransferase involved in cell wall biosynthesis